jgi:hypothetical protein
MRSAGGLDRESNAGDTSQGGRDLGSLSRLAIANREGGTSDFGDGYYKVRTGTR